MSAAQIQLAESKIPVLADIELHPKSKLLTQRITRAWEAAGNDEKANPDTWLDVMLIIKVATVSLESFKIFHIRDDLDYLWSLAAERHEMATLPTTLV